MKLFYIDPHPVPDTTPSTLQMLQMVDALAEVGCDVTLVATQPRIGAETVLDRPLAAPTHYFSDWRRRWFFPSSSHKPFYWRLLPWLKRAAPDAVLVRNLKLADLLLQVLPQLPLFFETHEVFAQSFRDEHPQPDRRQQRKLAALVARERRVYTRARGLFTLTQLLLDDIRASYGSKVAARVLPDGVDMALAMAAPPALRNAGDLPRLLYLGSLHRWKGVETAIRAMADIHGAELWVVGGSDQRIAELGQLAEQLGVASRVRFRGRVEPRKRFEVIAECDICLLPLTHSSIGSRYTSPLKLFEYMAMGRAILASDLPSLREILRDGDNGRLVPAEDPAALAKAANALLADPDLCQRLGASAARSAQAYTWRARAENAQAFISSQLGR